MDLPCAVLKYFFDTFPHPTIQVFTVVLHFEIFLDIFPWYERTKCITTCSQYAILLLMQIWNFFLGLIRECWNEDPLLRPDFKLIRDRTKKNLKQGKKTNIVDQMMEKMDKYTNNLEDLVAARTKYVYLGNI